MLAWLRENVVVDRVRSVLGSGCFLVARACAAMIVLMVAAFVSCGCANGPDYPSRDAVHAALISATWGMKVLADQCQHVVNERMDAGDKDKAEWFAQSCSERLRSAKGELSPALEEMTDYGPDSYRHVGCHLSGTLEAYRSMRTAMETFGYGGVDVEDGEAQARWLVSRAGNCK